MKTANKIFNIKINEPLFQTYGLNYNRNHIKLEKKLTKKPYTLMRIADITNICLYIFVNFLILQTDTNHFQKERLIKAVPVL
jgi:hypothetical protein